MEYLYVICLGLLLFFSISLISKKQKSLSEWIFTIWIAVLVITVCSFIMHVKGLSGKYPVFNTLICDSHLVHGAILYVYVLAFTNSKFKLKPVHYWHLLPVLLFMSIKFLLNAVFDKMQCYNSGVCIEESNFYVTMTYIYKYLVLGVYIYLSRKEVLRFKKQVNTPRDFNRHEWVKQISLGVIFLYLGILVLYIGRHLFPELFWEQAFLGNTLTTLFILIFLYIGNSYAYLFVSPSKVHFKNLSETFNPANCKKTIHPGQAEELIANIRAYMEKEKPFVKGPLTLKSLSELTGMPATSISQAINNSTGRSVTDFINKYRVDLLKEKIKDPKNRNYTIMALASDCGFSSKTTLIRIFKQHVGLTPSAYLESVWKHG